MLDLTGYKLTFDDEFNTRSISQTGAGTTWADIRSNARFDANSDIGFGHSSFVDASSGYDPFAVSGGALKITAAPPNTTTSGYPGSWQSGLITTEGNFSQTYGYFEVRANFSAQPGAWDAFWLLPDHSTPDPYNAGHWQELDIVEHYGDFQKGVYSTIHTTDAQNGIPWQQNRQVYSELSNPSGYHTYGLNWQADYLSFYVDGVLVGKQVTPSDMHSSMHMLVDLATQNSGNNNADTAGVPISSYIDYVRAYSNAPDAVGIAQQTVSSPDGHDPGLYGATAVHATVAATPVTTVSSPVPAASDPIHAASDPVPVATIPVAVASDPVPVPAAATPVAVASDPAPAAAAATPIAAASDPVPAATTSHASTPAIGGNEADVARLYYSLLERAPDASGLNYFTAAINNGQHLSDIANMMMSSGEYKQLSTGLSDAQFVDTLYTKILGRAGDSLGESTWNDFLSHGGSRGAALGGFTDSLEFQNKYAGQSSGAYVEALYETILDRHGDTGGLQNWTTLIDSHTLSRTDVAHAFTGSAEFQNKYVEPSAASFVDSVYVNALGRHAEATGLASWTAALAHGSSRSDVAVGIAESTEAHAFLIDQIQHHWPLA